jgi:hypothetical protein
MLGRVECLRMAYRLLTASSDFECFSNDATNLHALRRVEPPLRPSCSQ